MGYIRDYCSEWYEIPPGFVIRDAKILGKSPILLGIKRKRKKILFPFEKPCSGTQVLEIDACDIPECDRIVVDIRVVSGEPAP